MINKHLQLEACVSNLEICTAVLQEAFDFLQAPFRFQMQFMLAFEELFVNICNYAYSQGGMIEVDILADADTLQVTLRDNGVPFNPIEKEEPDLHAGVEERPIGGLGIYLSRKLVDQLDYRYQDGFNVSTLTKTK